MVMHNRRFGSPNRGYSRSDSKSATRFVLDEDLAVSDEPVAEAGEIAALLRDRAAAPEPHRRVPLEEPGDAGLAAEDARLAAVAEARRSIRSEVREMTREIRPPQRHTEIYRAPERPNLLRRIGARVRAWFS